MSDPRHAIGDLVTHRASGARGVVVGCTPVDVAGLPASYEYDVRTGFGETAQALECELEAVADGPSLRARTTDLCDRCVCGHADVEHISTGCSTWSDSSWGRCTCKAFRLAPAPARPLRVGDEVELVEPGEVTAITGPQTVAVRFPSPFGEHVVVAADLRRVAAGEGERD